MFRKTRSFVYQAVGRFIAHLLIRSRPGQRRVLLACHNSLMATYLGEVHDLIKDDPRILVRASVKTPEEAEGEMERCKAILRCRLLGPRISKLLPWDLVIVANHPGVFEDVAVKCAREVLRIPHGIGSKRVNGLDYMYNEGCFDEGGEFIYTRFFESSHERRDQAVAQSPLFEGKIAVVGSIRLDRIEERRKTAAPLSGRSRKSVLVVGSWGEGNLFEHLQQSDFATSAGELAADFTFRLRPHPNLVSSVNPDASAFRKQLEEWARLENVEVSLPDNDLEDDLAGCDLLLGDDLTSVSLYASALDVPVALWRSGNPGVGEGTYLSRLGEILPPLESDDDLGGVLNRALAESHSPARREFAENLRAFPNEAESRAREEIYELLELSVPEPARA